MRYKVKNFLLEIYWYVRRTLFPPQFPKNADGKVYVNLGSAGKTSAEFINIDQRTLPKVHYIADVTDLHMFPDNSVDMIYACHLVEHIPRSRLVQTMKEWRRALKPGGIFRFAVPNFDALVEVYTRNGNDVPTIENQLMGQDAPYDNHCTAWNTKYAEKVLHEAGFTSVRPWDPTTAEHHTFNDKATRTMTADGKAILISLNIEAIK